MKGIVEKIEDLGFDAFFESNCKALKLDGFSVARVIAEYRGAYRVKGLNGEYLAKITGRQMFEASDREDFPAVGDWVVLDKNNSVIRKILPRKTIIKRKSNGKNEIQIIAANIDCAFAIESVDRDYNLNRFERYLAIANEGGATPAIILNKIDLVSKEELDSKVAQIKNRLPGIDVILASNVTEEGLDQLKKYIRAGKTYCFLGSSGVGKSSLINKLIGSDEIKTAGIGMGTERGKHTTTSREMYFLQNGGIVIDNPGMREVGIAAASTGINNVFDEISVLAQKCKFVDCTHAHEPGCEVLLAVKSGKLDEDKYNNYLNLKKEAEYYELTDYGKRKKDRKFGKFLKNAKKELKEYGHKNW